MAYPDQYPTIRDKGIYQIQNIDLGTFLERRDTGVVLRPSKKTSDNQKWVFVQKKPNVYEIKPVTNMDRVMIGEDYLGKYSLGLETTPVQFQGSNIGTSWKLYTASPFNDQVFIVNDELRTRRTNNYLLYVNTKDDPTIEPDGQMKADQNFHLFDKGEEYLWRLIEVTSASLPDGDSNGLFRIRTLNGMAIHSLPDRDSLSIKNQGRGDHRAWNIVDMGNGHCTVYNMERKKYLATKLVSDNWEPVLADSPPLALTLTGSTAEQERDNSPWRIEAIGDYTWFIYVIRGTNRFGFQGRDKLSLSLKDDTVILKPWKKAHNQMWMIEPTDAPLPVDAKPNTGNNEIIQGSPLAPNKAYSFSSSDKLGGIRVAFKAPGYEASFVKPPAFSPSPLLMERKPSGQDGEICIYRLLNQQKYYLALSGNQVKVGLDQYFWTIERAKSPVFYLIRDTQSKLCLAPDQSSLVVKSQSSADDTTAFWAID